MQYTTVINIVHWVYAGWPIDWHWGYRDGERKRKHQIFEQSLLCNLFIDCQTKLSIFSLLTNVFIPLNGCSGSLYQIPECFVVWCLRSHNLRIHCRCQFHKYGFDQILKWQFNTDPIHLLYNQKQLSSKWINCQPSSVSHVICNKSSKRAKAFV